MPIVKIVSGGESGADQGGIEAAIHCGLPYGGWIPSGRLYENGRIPAQYGELTELPATNYDLRTEANIIDSDMTVVFTEGQPTGGSRQTIECANKYSRPVLHVDLQNTNRDTASRSVAEWIKDFYIKNCIINVAGSTESKSPGIQRRVFELMVEVIFKVNGTLYYVCGEEGLKC